MNAPGDWPTVTLSCGCEVRPEVVRHLEVLLQARCGPCHLDIDTQAHAPWARTTYTLDGPWTLPPQEVHRHLVAAFVELCAS